MAFPWKQAQARKRLKETMAISCGKCSCGWLQFCCMKDKGHKTADHSSHQDWLHSLGDTGTHTSSTAHLYPGLWKKLLSKLQWTYQLYQCICMYLSAHNPFRLHHETSVWNWKCTEWKANAFWKTARCPGGSFCSRSRQGWPALVHSPCSELLLLLAGLLQQQAGRFLFSLFLFHWRFPIDLSDQVIKDLWKEKVYLC